MSSDRSISPPIVIADQEHRGKVWVAVYTSVDDVEGHLEAWYAADEDYRAYDSVGRRLKLLADEERDTVRVEVSRSEPEETALRALLIRFLAEQRRAQDLHARRTTRELIDRAAAA